jgi:hypothetical protein
VGETILQRRDLNRATLARQLLLVREKSTPTRAVERLAGLQAQLARPPYIGLWSRVLGFTREQLTRAIERRQIVRATLMRGTLHLLGAADFLRLRSALQPMLDRSVTSVLRERAKQLDVPALVTEARDWFGREPRTFDELRDHLAGRFPRGDHRAMAYAVRCTLPLVQVPAAGCDWGYPGAADFAVADDWLGAPIASEPDEAQLVLRYLAAFGPASVADAQAWSGLRSLGQAFEALRPRLRVFRDERGRPLHDLPRAPRPGGEVPAPVRFLPDYDNLVLGHEDRSRVIADAYRPRIVTGNLQVKATFLVDGFVAGTWKTTRTKKAAALEITPFQALARGARDELAAEGRALLAFVEPDAGTLDVRFARKA